MKAFIRGRSFQVRHIESITTLPRRPASMGCQVLPPSKDVLSLLVVGEFTPELEVIATNPPLNCFTSKAAPPALSTTTQFSPLSTDLIILFQLTAISTPFASAKFPTKPPVWTSFQVFPSLIVLKRRWSVLMKIVPPAVSKARSPAPYGVPQS